MKTVEVSIKDLIIAILHRWWIVLLCGVLGFSLTYLKPQPNPPEVTAEDLAIYQEKLAAYNKQYAIYGNSLKQMEVSLRPYEAINEQSMQYLKNSLLIQIDPFNAERAFVEISLISEENNNHENVLLYCLEAINKMPLQSVLGEAYPESLDENVVREIITAKQISDSVLNVQCYYIEEPKIDAIEIVKKVYEYIKSQTASSMKVNLEVINTGIIKTIDYDLDLFRNQKMSSISKNYDDFIRRSNTVSQQREVYRAYEKTKPSEPSRMKVNANYSLVQSFIGMFGGAFLASLIIIVFHLIKLPIQTHDQVKKQLKIRYLGEINDACEGDTFSEEPYRIIVASICGQTEDIQRIILLGRQASLTTVSSIANKLSEIGEGKGLFFSAGNDVFGSSETIEKLNEADGAIMVVKKNVSTIREVSKEIEKINEFSTKVMGYVFVK